MTYVEEKAAEEEAATAAAEATATLEEEGAVVAVEAVVEAEVEVEEVVAAAEAVAATAAARVARTCSPAPPKRHGARGAWTLRPSTRPVLCGSVATGGDRSIPAEGTAVAETREPAAAVRAAVQAAAALHTFPNNRPRVRISTQCVEL